MEKTLIELHELLAKELLARIQSGEEKASILNVARQFLKDNSIEAIPAEGSTIKELVEELPFEITDEDLQNGTE
jgi:hypothetical protein